MRRYEDYIAGKVNQFRKQHLDRLPARLQEFVANNEPQQIDGGILWKVPHSKERYTAVQYTHGRVLVYGIEILDEKLLS